MGILHFLFNQYILEECDQIFLINSSLWGGWIQNQNIWQLSKITAVYVVEMSLFYKSRKLKGEFND